MARSDARQLAQRRHDARALMKEPEFRRLAEWLCRPANRLPHGGSDRESAFKAGQWFAANELRELLQAVDFDNFQRMEREARVTRVTHGVHEAPDSSDS